MYRQSLRGRTVDRAASLRSVSSEDPGVMDLPGITKVRISHWNISCPPGSVARFICYTRKLQLILHSWKISRECFDWKEDPQGEVIILEGSAKAGVLCKVVLGSHGGDASGACGRTRGAYFDQETEITTFPRSRLPSISPRSNTVWASGI
jgi:hypothetical protein